MVGTCCMSPVAPEVSVVCTSCSVGFCFGFSYLLVTVNVSTFIVLGRAPVLLFGVWGCGEGWGQCSVTSGFPHQCETGTLPHKLDFLPSRVDTTLRQFCFSLCVLWANFCTDKIQTLKVLWIFKFDIFKLVFNVSRLAKILNLKWYQVLKSQDFSEGWKSV